MAKTSQDSTDRHLWQITAVRELFWISLALSLLLFGYHLRSIFTPVLIGLGLAYLFNPLITAAEIHWKLRRPLTISLLLILLVLAGLGFAAWLGPIVIHQASNLVQKLPVYLANITERFGISVGPLIEQLDVYAARIQEDPLAFLRPIFTKTGKAFGFLGDFLSMSGYILITLILIPIYFFFFSLHFDPMLIRCKKLLPAKNRNRTVQIAKQMDQAVSSFFRGRLIISLIMGGMLSLGWLLAGVPYWFLLGLVTGLLSIVPYVSAVGWPVAVLLKYLDVTTGGGGVDWLAVTLWPSVVYVIVQAFEGWFLTPWIQGKSADLSAVAILIVIFIGGAVGGLYGMLLAIPIAACVKIFLKEVLLPRWEHWAAEN